ncbi:MAG: TolC family protein [Polyangiaceae bacterium]|nr:TolC family protein [Polyangiaceae bacterium]MCW5791275.1 TolC family protein [Polyangiaceae bacterium]
MNSNNLSTWILGLLTLLIAGCAAAPHPEPRAPSADATSEGAQAASAADLEGLEAELDDDPGSSSEYLTTSRAEPRRPAPPLPAGATLPQLLAYAEHHSPLLLVARATRSRAEAAKIAASPLWRQNPEVTVAAGPRLGAAGTGFDLELSLTQQILIGGERRAELAHAERLRELSEAELSALSWAMQCEVRRGFARASAATEQARLTRLTLEFSQQVARIAARQVAAGERAPLAERLARAEAVAAQQRLVQAEQTAGAARIQLAALIGADPSRPPTPSGDLPTPRPAPPLAPLVRAARRHPSQLARAAAVRAAEARMTAAERRALRPSLGVSYTREGPKDRDAEHVILGSASLPIPSFDAGQGPRAAARADWLIARAELRAQDQQLIARVVEARAAVDATASRARAYQDELLPEFEENLTLLRRAFEVGEIDLLGLAAGQERLVSIQSEALAARLDHALAVVTLMELCGVDPFEGANR